MRRCLTAVLLTVAATMAAGDIRTVIARKSVAGEPICAAQALPLFYERRAHQPAWNDADANELIAAILRAPEDGLRPADYHLAAILSLPSGDESDVLLTDAFFLLAGHLLAGRFDPQTIEPTWCLEPRTADLVSALETALENHEVRETLAVMPPSHPDYRRLREELARYRAIESIAPVADRILQLELNLERWRWLPASLGERYAIVNIAEFQLRVVEQQKTVLSMRIVVGKDYLQTPIFSSRITQVVFSPYWNVPASIAAKELLPKGARYLQREHIEILPDGRLRQTPGPWNSLGLIKFNIPNRYDVYLHDTPARGLFQRPSRAFSHGCMRIEKPVDLAQYLLPAWTRDEIVAQSKRGAERVVAVPDPLPVHVLYWTAFVGDDGAVHFAKDVYGRDAVLANAIAGR